MQSSNLSLEMEHEILSIILDQRIQIVTFGTIKVTNIDAINEESNKSVYAIRKELACVLIHKVFE